MKAGATVTITVTWRKLTGQARMTSAPPDLRRDPDPPLSPRRGPNTGRAGARPAPPLPLDVDGRDPSPGDALRGVAPGPGAAAGHCCDGDVAPAGRSGAGSDFPSAPPRASRVAQQRASHRTAVAGRAPRTDPLAVSALVSWTLGRPR